MIFAGLVSDEMDRIQRPGAASNSFRPSVLSTFYKTHMNPFWRTQNAMTARLVTVPLPRQMGPQRAPQMPPPPPPVAPAAGPVTGGFGGTSGFRGGGAVSPYRTMRLGTFPGVNVSTAGIRNRATHAGSIIAKLTPSSQYKTAGNYR